MFELKYLFVIIAIALSIPGNNALVDEKNARTIISNNTQLRELCYETTKSHAAFNKTIEEAEKYEECLENISLNDMDKEIEAALSTFNFDPIIDKVCKAKDEIFTCLKPVSYSMAVCLPYELRALNKIGDGIVKGLADFACTSLNITTILSTIECAAPKESGLKACVENNYGELIAKKPETVDDIKLLYHQLNCTTFDNFSNCIVDELKTCDSNIPANLIKSLFEHIRNETPCANYA